MKPATRGPEVRGIAIAANPARTSRRLIPDVCIHPDVCVHNEGFI